jgi:hypothetical protein
MLMFLVCMTREVLTAIHMNITILWYVKQCSLVGDTNVSRNLLHPHSR